MRIESFTDKPLMKHRTNTLAQVIQVLQVWRITYPLRRLTHLQRGYETEDNHIACFGELVHCIRSVHMHRCRADLAHYPCHNALAAEHQHTSLKWVIVTNMSHTESWTLFVKSCGDSNGILVVWLNRSVVHTSNSCALVRREKSDRDLLFITCSVTSRQSPPDANKILVQRLCSSWDGSCCVMARTSPNMCRSIDQASNCTSIFIGSVRISGAVIFGDFSVFEPF